MMMPLDDASATLIFAVTLRLFAAILRRRLERAMLPAAAAIIRDADTPLLLAAADALMMPRCRLR